MSVEILIIFRVTTFAQHPKTFSSNGWRQPIIQGIKNQTPLTNLIIFLGFLEKQLYKKKCTISECKL